MPEQAIGPLKLEAWRRPNYGVSGPIEAKGKLTILGAGIPAIVIAVLLPEAEERPLLWGIGFTAPASGTYRVDLATKGTNLPLGNYRIREVVVPLLGPLPLPPLIQDVPVVLEPDMVSLKVVSAGYTPGSVESEIIYVNTGNHSHTFWVCALISHPQAPETLYVSPIMRIPDWLQEQIRLSQETIQELGGIAAFLETTTGVIEIYGPVSSGGALAALGLAPALPERIPDIGYRRGYKDNRQASTTRPFDPFDEVHRDRLRRMMEQDQEYNFNLSALPAVFSGLDLEQSIRALEGTHHATLRAIAYEDPDDAINAEARSITPPPDAPFGPYMGHAFVAESCTLGAESARVPPEDELWGWVWEHLSPAVWEHYPPFTAAAITSVRWWVED